VILTFPILYINSLHLSLTGPGVQADWARGGGWGGLLQIGPGVQADRARRGGWGRERFVTNRPGPALPDFVIDGCFINGYCWLLYVILQLLVIIIL